MSENNESTVSEIAEFDESAVMSSLEVHSTPNVGQDDKTMNTSSTNETDSTEDSGIQVTPTSTKYNKVDNDMMSIILNQFNELNKRFDSNDKRFDNRFDELKSEIHKQKVKYGNNFSELKNHINEINKNVDKTNEIFTSNVSKLEQNIERMGVWVINTG